MARPTRWSPRTRNTWSGNVDPGEWPASPWDAGHRIFRRRNSGQISAGHLVRVRDAPYVCRKRGEAVLHRPKRKTVLIPAAAVTAALAGIVAIPLGAHATLDGIVGALAAT